jgi:uncharacterized circularly permuted ATP-grasp superfamily protein/uncharacterized alpha-E superfamily protein
MSSTTPETDAAPAGGLIAGYRPPVNSYDELRLRSGGLREPWPRFVGGIERLGSAGLDQRREQARRLLRENGVTYNVYGAPQGPGRPWELDPLPLVISYEEWDRLSTALAQRVTVLNAILADLYGPQKLIARRVLPPELVFAHPGFLVPCHGLKVPSDVYLHLYAGHIVRGPDGGWVVLADRTQGPSGAGYAVENRVIMSRILPQDFHALYVERLASFFIALRETLLSIAPRNRDNPRVVLLSPGTRSTTYFEDGYLARYLGYSLAEGGDLTVRGSQVFLKTLGGLLPVDVILRRVPDEDADPLELKADSQLGVSGLVEAVREGQVAVANALGSGYLEALALMAYLPEICRELFGEELTLPSIGVWWCGRPDHLKYVESHLSELSIRPAFRHRSVAPILGWRLSQAEKADLLARIRQRPSAFVGQAQVVRSTAPVWNDSRLEPWRLGLRTFAVAHEGGYRVMPGALSRMSAQEGFVGESVSEGEVSKDVWVLASAPVKSVTLLKPNRAAIQLRRSGNDLPSRAADNLYWLGRFVERAERMVRHLRSAIVRLTSDVAPVGPLEVAALIEALSKSKEWHAEPNEDGEILLERIRAEAVSFIFDETRSDGLFRTLDSLRRTGSAIRDRLSIDSWRIVNQLHPSTLFPKPTEGARPGDLLLVLNQMVTLLSAFSGLATESMTRAQSWRFLDMGRRIERAQQTLHLLRRTLVEVRKDVAAPLEAILEIANSTMTYRYRYLTSLQLAPVLDLILVDETNPRAVGFQLAALAEHVKNLPGEAADAEQRPEPRIVLAAQAALRLCDVDAFCEPDETGERTALGNFLEQESGHLVRLSDALSQRYLSHTGPSHQLGMITPSVPSPPGGNAT